jgi:hypothetical protein
MLTKQSISFLVVSALLVLPIGTAKAGNIDVRTGDMRTTISQDSNIRVNNGRSEVIINRDRSSTPNYRNRHRQIYNSRLKNRTWRSPQVRRTQNNCKGGSYSHQSSQTTTSNNGVSRTRSSESTVCN